MTSATHQQHLAENVSHADCSECCADTERQWLAYRPFKYAYVHEYLSWAAPRIAAIRAGENSVNARIWHRDFMTALHRRISSHVRESGRKHSHSYLERMRGVRHVTDAWYLRRFAQRGASCLDR